MKRIFVIGFVAMYALIAFGWSAAFTINGAQPGAAASMTPVPVGTSTPVRIVACGSTLNAGGPSNTATLYYDIGVTGGTAGADGCYIAPAAAASPCAAASPAPNAGTKAGWFMPTGATGWTYTAFNYPSAGGGIIISSEWDAVCTAAGMSVSSVTLP